MAKSSMGLVLRANAVDAFQARRTMSGMQVAKCVSVPVAGSDDISVSEAIRQAATDARLTSTRVAVSIPSQDILLRAFMLPLLPRTEWTSAVSFEARKYIPFKMEELAWGYAALEQRATKQLAVTFAGIRLDRLHQIQRWLSLAGITPSLIEAQAVSLSRLTGQASQGVANQFIGIVDVDQQSNTAHIVIAKHAVPYLSREIVLKAEPSGAPPGQEPARAGLPDGVDSRVEILLSELRLSFDFFVREHPRAIIHQVQVFGQERVVAPWAGWLAQQLPCPVLLGHMSGLMPGLEQFGLDRAAAAGLALGALSAHPVKLDFLTPPASYSTAARPADLIKGLGRFSDAGGRLLKTLGVQVASAALAVGLMFGAAQYRLASVRQEMEQAVFAFADPGWQLKGLPMAALLPLKERVDRQVQFLTQAVARRVSTTQKLDQLVRVLPDGVWLGSLEYNDQIDPYGASIPNLKLRGFCYLGGNVSEEMRVISEFVRLLKQNAAFFRGFSVAQLGGISKSTDPQTATDYQTFQVTCEGGRQL